MFEGCARVNVRIPTNFINECFSSTQNWTPMQEQQNQYQIFELFKFNRQLFKVINCSLPWRWVSGDGVNLFNSFRLEIIFKFIMPYWQSFFLPILYLSSRDFFSACHCLQKSSLCE